MSSPGRGAWWRGDGGSRASWRPPAVRAARRRRGRRRGGCARPSRGRPDGHGLGDHPTHRLPEEVDALAAEGLHDGDDVGSHRLDAALHLAPSTRRRRGSRRRRRAAPRRARPRCAGPSRRGSHRGASARRGGRRSVVRAHGRRRQHRLPRLLTSGRLPISVLSAALPRRPPGLFWSSTDPSSLNTERTQKICQGRAWDLDRGCRHSDSRRLRDPPHLRDSDALRGTEHRGRARTHPGPGPGDGRTADWRGPLHPLTCRDRAEGLTRSQVWLGMVGTTPTTRPLRTLQGAERTGAAPDDGSERGHRSTRGTTMHAPLSLPAHPPTAAAQTPQARS